MNPLFSRLIGGKEKQENNSVPSIPLTIDSLDQHQRISVVGWIANRLGQLLDVEGCDNGKLITNTLNKDLTKLDFKKQEDYLLFLADCLVSWIEKGEDVYFKIRSMNLESNYHKHLLEIFEQVKSYENIYFNKKAIEKKETVFEDKEWEIYRDVIHAASNRKFLLVKDEDLLAYKSDGIIFNATFSVKADIPVVRNRAKEKLVEEGIPSSMVASCTLLISEAITNVLKHAKDGKILISKNDNSLNILIEDAGSGIPIKILPYTVLLEGYSTKKSLGKGFTLILKLTTRVLLKTASTGTTVVLVFDDIEGEENGKYKKSTS
ncbi:ATP-binding protein [Lysinibacillus fusiformis]|nr:ATP-binding protein [Lysinibacillus fusiformis]HWL22645.1 ATP-binding protein [Ureibacillus sp.]